MIGDRIFKHTFFASLVLHLLVLGGVSSMRFSQKPKPEPVQEKPEDITILIRKIRPQILPEVKQLGEQKKTKDQRPLDRSPGQAPTKDLLKKHELEKQRSKKKEKAPIQDTPGVAKTPPGCEQSPEISGLCEGFKAQESPSNTKQNIEEQKCDTDKCEASLWDGIRNTDNATKGPDKESMLRYQDMIRQKIQAQRRYPLSAVRKQQQGNVQIRFILLSNGTVKNLRILTPCRYSALNKEALDTVKRSSPFPPIPEDFQTSQLEMDVVIVFSLE